MRWLISCLLFLCVYCCTGQQYYETYTPANGLVDARVNKMMQDGSGRLFFLTRDGLSIFDGQRFSNYTKLAGQPVGIIDDGIVLADSSLQLATFSGKWISIKKKNNDPDSILQENIKEVSAIVTLQQNEWLIVSNFGLFQKKGSGLFPVRTSSFLQSQKNPFDNVSVSGNSIVFSYTINGNQMLYTCDRNGGGITDSLKGYNISAIRTDLKGNIHICTSSGLFELEPESLKKGKLRMQASGLQKNIPGSFLTHDLFFDRQQHAWLINREKGCYKLNSLTKQFSFYGTADGLFSGISSIFQDRENNIWFIANGKGVQKLVQTNYEVLSHFGGKPGEQVLHLGPGDDGSLLFHKENGFSLLKNNIWTLYPNRDASIFYPSFYWQNDYWAYVSKTIITSFDGRLMNVPLNPSQPDVTHFPSPHISFDKKGNVLLAGNRFVLLKKDQSAESYSLPYFADNITEAADNHYRVFCRSNHVVSFRLANGRLEQGSSFSHPGLEPRFSLHWNKDTFWIASRYNGILIAKVNDTSLSVISRLGRRDGLSNDFIETLFRIDNNRVAAGTAAGLDIITVSNNDTAIENLSARINHFEPILQVLPGDNGSLYVRTENMKVFRYNPFLTTSSSFTPDLWINKLVVNGTQFPISVNRFSSVENNFQFSLSAPSFIDNRRTLFEFKLTGEKNRWQQKNNNGDFSISNLPPGKYSLQIRVKYAGSIYPARQLEYTFIITPPFWRTWWFRLLLVAIVLLTGGMLIRSYLRRQLQEQKIIMEKELAIEQERTKMARELHDGLGSMLSGIKHSFSAMKNEVELDSVQEAKFHTNIDKLNESISELRNISHSMASESLLKYGLENSLRDYCSNISQPGKLDITFETFETGKMSLTDEQSFHIFRIIQELFQNIIKHAAAKNAIVQLSYNNRHLYITVEDNGRGFDSTHPRFQKGMGIKNIQSRVRILNGKLDYRSSAAGTSVLVEIPCTEKI